MLIDYNCYRFECTIIDHHNISGTLSQQNHQHKKHTPQSRARYDQGAMIKGWKGLNFLTEISIC